MNAVSLVNAKRTNYYFLPPKNTFILLVFLFLAVAGSKVLAGTSSCSVNKLFKKVTLAQPYTFFCHLPISPQGKVHFQSCGYCPIEQVSIVVMPIVPYEFLAKNLPCYQHKLCSKPNSRFYQGLQCCKKIDIFYQRMSQDLHNLVAETRHVKQLRAQHFPGILPNVTPTLGCNELISDKKRHVIHIPEAQRGPIARIYLYMNDTYQLKLDQSLLTTLESWHSLYKVTDWEKTRNRLIFNEQGTYNRRIEELHHEQMACAIPLL